jgi:uncharacterized membrane protein YfcA
MIHLICGLIIGGVMGLTGAGGALVAIPLFMQFLGQDLKTASIYSLVAVALASLLNFVAQKSYTQYRIGMILVFSSAIGSFLTAPFKAVLPSYWIALILSVVSVYALFSVWFPFTAKNGQAEKPNERFWMSLIVGLSLGALTTFTGLGGGVLMLPILLGVYRLHRSEAVATSLFTVGLSSLSSLAIQVFQGANLKLDFDFMYLVVGILSAALLLKKYSSRLREKVLMRFQQVVFTVVVVLALGKILL